MCDPKPRTMMEKVLDEQRETNELLRRLIALRHTPTPSKREKILQIQRILDVSVDGIIGPETRRAFNYLEQ